MTSERYAATGVTSRGSVEVSGLEISANLVNLVSVLLAAMNHVLTWSVGIAGCVLYGVMFFQQRLYADVTLQVYFTVTSVMGWYHWIHGGANRTERPVSVLPCGRFVRWCGIAVVAAGVYGSFLSRWTDASFPYTDSVVLSFSVLAQILLLERLVENWLCWMVVNVIAVPLYFAKGLYLTSAIYAIFLVNAVCGYRHWRRILGANPVG